MALIEKEPVTKNYLDQYRVYVIDDTNLEIGCILSLYIDLMDYRRAGDIVIRSTSVEHEKT